MLRPALIAAALVAASVAAPPPAAAQERGEAELEALILDTIRANPEIVMEAVAILQAREAEAAAAAAEGALSALLPTLVAAEDAVVGGNPEGDVTLVEFFDYNCGFCRRAHPELEAALAADPEIRVVYREWPILGDGSVVAARAALAAREQGLYVPFHDALMTASGRLDERAVMEIAAEVGLDADRLRADMEAPAVEAHIAESMRMAQALGFTGTPSFVIGEELVGGMIDAGQMGDLVEAARAAE
jgi:protein-disulfide isomerase